jgi:hypothetical protein
LHGRESENQSSWVFGRQTASIPAKCVTLATVSRPGFQILTNGQTAKANKMAEFLADFAEALRQSRYQANLPSSYFLVVYNTSTFCML